MRKLLVLAVALALVSLAAVDLMAAEGSELEISGNATTVTGWQHVSKATGFGVEGILRDGLTVPGANTTDTFGFYVDQLELDLAKSFGENIRVRGDIDVAPNRVVEQDTGAGGAIELEQGYVTANMPVGNGMEFLVGKFNSGIGMDPIDRNQLSTVSFSTIHRTLLPHNLTGLRLGYDFSEATRLEVFVVNDLADHIPVAANTAAASSDIPSVGFNLNYAWGDSGNKSWVRFTGAGGPEQATKKHESFLGDLSGNWAVSDAFWVGAEGIYRQDDTPTAAAANAKYIGGQLKGRYAFSDVWDGTLRYGFVWDLNGGVGATQPVANHLLGNTAATTGLGAAGNLHTLSVATGYQITDGARLVVEGGIDLSRSHFGGTSAITSGLAGMFAYSF